MAAVARRAGAVAALTVALTLGLTACGSTDGSTEGSPHAVDIGLLLPVTFGRWENFDRPGIERTVRRQCRDCTVQSANAQGDVATQQQQVDSMITRGVDVLIVAPVDAKAISSSVERARDAGIPVIAYDRLAEGPISAYVSFDSVQVGRLMAQALLRALGDRAAGATVVMMNGDPSDPNAGQVRRGALHVLSGRVDVGASYDTLTWNRELAYGNMAGAITDLGPDRIDGVLAASDTLASGVIAAMKAAGFTRLPPVTGQDADLNAVQEIVQGEQYMTVYKPFDLEARPAALMALALGKGESIDGLVDHSVANDTRRAVPAKLVTPLAVTAATIGETVVRDGFYTVDQICTRELRAACERVGLLTGQTAD